MADISQPQFWRSKEKTDTSYLDMVNRTTKQNFTSAVEAKTWLNNNGYYTTIITLGTITTTSLSNITTTTVDTGGNVTNDGGDTGVVKGVCYNTTGTPTTGDTHTHNGTGTGSFTSNLTGLTSSTNYYIRAYATNSVGTSYGTTLSGTTLTPPPQPTIGDTHQGGIIFYITAPTAGATSGTAGLISKTTNRSTTGVWGCYGTAVSGADGTAIGTGNQNTIDIHNQGCSHVPVAANYCYDLNDGTYSDWWLPSKNELNQMYVRKSVIGGFVTGNYCSSSEYSASSSWSQSFANGFQYYVSKNYVGYYVRAVRGFQ